MIRPPTFRSPTQPRWHVPTSSDLGEKSCGPGPPDDPPRAATSSPAPRPLRPLFPELSRTWVSLSKSDTLLVIHEQFFIHHRSAHTLRCSPQIFCTCAIASPQRKNQNSPRTETISISQLMGLFSIFITRKRQEPVFPRVVKTKLYTEPCLQDRSG